MKKISNFAAIKPYLKHTDMKVTQHIRPALLLLAAIALIISVSCKRQDSLYENDRSDIIPVFTKDSVAQLLDLRTGNLRTIELRNISDISQMHEGLMVAKCVEEGRETYYYINAEGQVVLGPYASAGIFSSGKAWVAKERDNLTAIDHQGQELFKLKSAQTAQAFCRNLALFMTETSEKGLINDKGEVLIRPQQGIMIYRVGHRLMAKTDSLYVIVNDKSRNWREGLVVGSVIVPKDSLDSADQFMMQAADCFLTDAKECQLFNSPTENYTHGISTDVDINRRIHNLMDQRGWLIAGRRGLWGILDINATDTATQWVVEPRYRQIIPDEKGFMIVDDGLLNWVDSQTGDSMSEQRYLFGWMDMDGRETIEPRFVLALPFGAKKQAIALDADFRVGLVNRYGEWRAYPDELPCQHNVGIKIPYKERYVYTTDEGIGIRRRAHGGNILPSADYRLPDDMWKDHRLLSDFMVTRSDYINLDEVVEGLRRLIVRRRVVTGRELVNNYEGAFTEQKLMQLTGKDAKMYTFYMSDTLAITQYVCNINVRTTVYTGWMERLYDVVFSGASTMNRFRYELRLSGKLKDRFVDFAKAMEQSGDWSRDGRKVTITIVPKEEMVVVETAPGQ